MDGILVVDKPAGFTSFDVVAKLRGICATRKIGHGGTLDPMATGVLPVFIGNAAKAVDMQIRQDKTYEAEILFGIKTDTGDITGEVIEKADTDVSAAMVAAVLPQFSGVQSQLPPMYSAVKMNGKPLYRYAREGVEVERKPREVTIHKLEVMGAGQAGLPNHVCILAHCSKGTYIRTLAEEIGAALGVPATLAALRRTQAGMFDLFAAHTLEQIQEAKRSGTLEHLLLSIEVVFAELPLLNITEEQLKRLLNGAPVYSVKHPAGRYRVRWNGAFSGLACLDEDGQLCAEKMFSAVRG